MPPTNRKELEALMHALEWQREDEMAGRFTGNWDKYSDDFRVRELLKDYNLAWRMK